MSANPPGWQGPDALRERAVWYRGFAKVCAGDGAWALRLADYFDKLAEELESKLDPHTPLRS